MRRLSFEVAMSTARVTADGQVKLPTSVRDALGVQEGDRVEFVVRADGGVELVPRSRSLLSLAGILGEDRQGASIEDLDSGIAEQILVELDGEPT